MFGLTKTQRFSKVEGKWKQDCRSSWFIHTLEKFLFWAEFPVSRPAKPPVLALSSAERICCISAFKRLLSELRSHEIHWLVLLKKASLEAGMGNLLLPSRSRAFCTRAVAMETCVHAYAHMHILWCTEMGRLKLSLLSTVVVGCDYIQYLDVYMLVLRVLHYCTFTGKGK